MKRATALLLCLCLFLAYAPALGEEAARTVDFRMAGYDSADTGHDWDNNFFFLRREEATGIRFAYSRYADKDEWDSYKANLVREQDLPDMLFKAELTPAETLSLYRQGLLIDVKPYIQEYMPNLAALLREHPDWESAITLPDGAIVALPLLDELQNNNDIWINSKWLRKIGREMPATADELTEVLRLFKSADPNSNGKSDEIPLTYTGMWDLRFLAHAYGIIMNDYYVETDGEGHVYSPLTSDENRAFLAWLHLLWQEGLIDHNGLTTADTTRAVTDSNATIPYGVVFGPTMLSMLPSSALGDYEILMPLAWEGRQVYRSFLGEVHRGACAITSACQDPAALLAWVDFLYSEEGCYLARSGALDEEYERHSDGTWAWIDDAETVSSVVMQDMTIAEGGTIPGFVPASYNLLFDEESTHRTVEMLARLKEFSRMPYPMVYLTEEEQAVVNRLWPELSRYCETQMTWFMVGDEELNDETWDAFCRRVEELGMPEMIAVWQAAADRNGPDTMSGGTD
ncbi:MAG: hypothetical protein J5865_01475 [Lachnospiraceae bacterium]|nr:hypothetical protein [Lachnospiraceae bacterium]